MAFDPDAYLSGGTAVKEFDPDVYLAADVPSLDPQVISPEGDQSADEHDFLYYKTGKTKSEREALNAPLREAMQVPAVAPETITRVLQALNTTDEQGPVQQGIDEAISRAGSAMTTGEGVASLPLYIFPPTAVGLQAENTAELPAQVQDAIERARQGDIKGAASTGTDALLNVLMTAGVVHGGAKLMGGERVPLRVEPTLAERITQPRVEPVVPEKIAASGFKLPDGSIVDTGPYHSQGEVPPGSEAGFITTTGRFVGREEAGKLATGLKQPLFAEDFVTNKDIVPSLLEHPIAEGIEPGMPFTERPYVPPDPPAAAPQMPATVPEAVVPSGKPVSIKSAPDHEFFVYKTEEGVWHTAEKETGLPINIGGKTKAEALAQTEKMIETAGVDKLQLAIDRAKGVQPAAEPVPVQVPEAAPPAPVMTPGAAKKLAKLKAHKAQVEAIGGKVDPDKVTAKIAEIEGVPPEAPVQAQEGPSFASEAPGGVQGAETPIGAAEPPPQGAGAPPVEVPPSERGYAGMEPLPTSTKNIVTAAERETRGLPPAEEAAARDFGTVWDESAKDTTAPARLVASLKVEPRALSDVENAHLLRRQIELQTEHDTMTKAVNEASDPAVAAEAKQRLETVRNDLQDVYDVGKAAGTETGRGLNARKMLADQDYALSNMEATTRALVNDGKPLSEAQLSEVAKLHERIRTAEDKLAAYESQEIFNQSLKAAPRRPVLSFLDEQAVKARERINARRTRLYADPLGITNVAHLADEAIIGASHIARGVTRFADWSAQMVSEFGDRIKPYLAALFEKSKQQFKNASAGLKKAPVTYAEREARALAGEKKGIITRTEKLIGRTEVVTAEHPFGEFEPLKRRPPRMDPEKAQLQYEYRKAKEAFDRGIYEAELKKRSRPERILGTAREVLNMPRSLLASADFSAVRRQGGIYTMIHPLRARHAFRAMLEATKSEQGYFKVMQEIRDRPNAPEYQRYGLELTDIGPVTRAKMEEQFQSRWAGKIPGISHSQRAYTGFLNRARADWFDLLKDSLAKKGEPLTPKQGKAIANAVNVFTGRGAMNQKWIGAMTALNDVFFAPRWRASRFQTLIGQPLWKNSGARGVIAKEYAKALIGYGSILTLIGWATKNTLHPMEKNPVSTEAGKLRVGNTRIDFLQGLQQPTVLLSRLFSGRTKTAMGEVQKIYGDVPLGKTTSSDIITRFLRSSLAPVPGGVWNVLEGKNVIGEPVTLPSTVRDLTIPLLGKDIYDAMKDQGVPTGTALGLLALFGDGIQTYSPRVSQKAPKREPTVSQRIKAAKAKRTRERKKVREE